MENNVSKLVESIVSDDISDMISDMKETNRYVNKLQSYVDDLEDKKIKISKDIMGCKIASDIRKLKDDISTCDKIIKEIKGDISYVKTTSMLYTFYRKARKILPKDILADINKEVNSHMLINKLSIGDELQCIIPCDSVNRGDICECTDIDKFNNLVSVNNINKYYNINNFRPLQ